MLGILSLLKGNKILSGLLGVICLVGILLFSWNSVKGSIYEDGYKAAVSEYQIKLIEQHNDNIKDTEGKLIELRSNLKVQYQKDLERTMSEQEVDTKVITNTEFIEKEVYIENTCNVVDPDLISLFNKSINSINGVE